MSANTLQENRGYTGRPSLDQPQMRVPPVTRRTSFSHGLFDVFGNSSCLLACVCPCWVYARNKQVLNQSGSIAPDACLYLMSIECGLCLVPSCLGASTRSDIRNERNIDGNTRGDFLAHLCIPCALAQEAKELELLVHERMVCTQFTRK